ncbi:DNA-binding response regulator, OmpR family, contains REC and winged-helix (wHTH) domain [Eubacterium uniforme]|uniref:Stage 0 sporulation protein A homolog n=1 Tax=Eubacterium uniforme TaxID=39495 RepID=A0A1T4VE31_9FIRM|nr:response regulator transcription factor [Eubacterium uniforme]SKA63143.1 DNA-binding response regulator, OmpR family, contains REC and winged-helix (wHTH) domain [Eubacterium uniforme]HAV90681.1 DNA-binding response regulator [Eubacterium sp.]
MRILIAEDEIATAKALKLLLEKLKYSVDIVYNGMDAWQNITRTSYDVIVLDIMMPGISGLEVLALIRKNNLTTPVLLLTAKAELEDRVAGLDAGADDYLPKPFATAELIARIKALGRRSENFDEQVKKIGNIALDSNKFELSVDNEKIKLTNKEFQLLDLFVRYPGHIFSTEHLMEIIWGFDTDSEVDVVWTHIGFVRKKLKKVGANVEIVTKRGAGYSLEGISE